MRHNLDDAMDTKDAAKLIAGFNRVATFAPDPSWNSGDPSWASIAKSGAAAAKSGDFSAAQQTCKTCHRTFRGKYKESYRLRPLPL